MLEFVEKSFVRRFKSTKPPVDGLSSTTTPNYKNDFHSAIKTIPHKRTNRTTEQHPLETKKKQTRLRDKRNAKRRKRDDKWVRNVSPHPLDETERQVMSYAFKKKSYGDLRSQSRPVFKADFFRRNT